MLNKTIIEYIKASRNARVQEYFIRQALLEAGWDRDEVDEALDSETAWPSKARVDFIAKTKEAISLGRIKNRHERTPRANLIIFVWIILIIVFIGLFVWILPHYLNPSYEIILPTNDETDLSFQFGSWPALENADFFQRVKKQFVESNASFIEGDLSDMKLRIYTRGVLEKEVSILSKGREGSWWETPAGLYQVQSKSPDHFSSFGQVYMPWSMAFQGNFFIHGWPYYSDGEPVAFGYSGGCIRLSTEDAKAIYNLASTGMPVLVFESGFEKDGFEYGILESRVDAKSFLGADLKNNFVFAEKDSTTRVPIASLTKLVTAIVATEYINIERTIVITSDMLVPTSKPRLQVGQKATVLDLLYPLLTESSNEAGVAIAKVLGTERFVELMNEKARAIGMKDTRFADATGSSYENVSTAQDLFQLAKYLYNNRTFVLTISRGDIENSAYNPPLWSELGNFNIFSEDPNFVGGKVGKSNAAGETVLSIFEIEKSDIKRPIVTIILGSENGTADATSLINFIKEGY
jgi:D-alanyl-D-alanine carboxypeptidase